jgi:hypothetical protein
VSRLTAAQRKALPDSAFAGKGRTFPVHDRNHALEAKIQAKRKLDNGTMSRAEYNRIVAAANKTLGRTGKSLKEKLG